MKKKIIIFKNDNVGDLVHSVPAIKDIISQNLDKEVVIFLSKNSEKFIIDAYSLDVLNSDNINVDNQLLVERVEGATHRQIKDGRSILNSHTY